MLPFYGSIWVIKFGLKHAYHPLNKLGQLIHPVKDSLGLWIPRFTEYRFLSGKVYIDQAGCTILECFAEHSYSIRLNCPVSKTGFLEQNYLGGNNLGWLILPGSVQTQNRLSRTTFPKVLGTWNIWVGPDSTVPDPEIRPGHAGELEPGIWEGLQVPISSQSFCLVGGQRVKKPSLSPLPCHL